jgi:hypothetical protein
MTPFSPIVSQPPASSLPGDLPVGLVGFPNWRPTGGLSTNGGGVGLPSVENWEFAQRVWAGLRPHVRTRLWVLEARRVREAAAGCVGAAERLGRLADEVREVEGAVEEALQSRRALEDFNELLARRLVPCLARDDEV